MLRAVNFNETLTLVLSFEGAHLRIALIIHV